MRTLLDLILPTACAGCAAGAGPICAACRAGLHRGGGSRHLCVGAAGLLPVTAACGYAGSARRLLLAFKERGRIDLAAALAEALADAVGSAVPAGPLLLVPVPSQRSVRRGRGLDALGTVTCKASRQLRGAGRPTVVVPMLRHARRVVDQAGLDASSRADNLSQALVARPPRRRQVGSVVLVDDIVTTGATLREATRALAAVGVAVEAGAVVASTPRRTLGRTAAPPGDPSVARPSEGLA